MISARLISVIDQSPISFSRNFVEAGLSAQESPRYKLEFVTDQLVHNAENREFFLLSKQEMETFIGRKIVE